jgi:hypothetical protein
MCLKNIPNEFKLKKMFTVNSKFNWFNRLFRKDSLRFRKVTPRIFFLTLCSFA